MVEADRPGQAERPAPLIEQGLPVERSIALAIGVEAIVDPIQIVTTRYNALVEAQKNTSPQTSTGPKKRRTREEIIRGVENQFEGVDIRTILDTLYTSCQLSLNQISKVTGISHSVMYGYFVALNIHLRTMSEAGVIRHREDAKKGRRYIPPERTVESEERRIEAVRRAWATRKDEIVAKIHAGDSDKKRSESYMRKFATDPAYRELNSQLLKRAHQALIDKTAMRHQKLFGPDRKRGLEQMHYGEGLTPEEIAQASGYTTDTIYGFFKVDGINIITPNRQWLRKFREFSTFLPNMWTNQSFFNKLTPGQRYVIRRRFLTEGPTVPTLDEVGKELGLTKARIAQLEDRAIEKLGILVKSQSR